MLAPLFESVPPRLYGGTERVVYNLCRGLTNSDVEVVLFASGDSSVECKVIPVIEESLRLRKKPIYDPYAYHFKMLAKVAEFGTDFDIIHNHHDYWMLPLTKMIETPILTTAHGRMDFAETKAAFASYPQGYFVSISENQRKALPNLNWIKTIHHGINVHEIKFYEQPGKYLAFLGRITWEKRPDLAIEIALRSGVPLKIAAKIEGKASQEYFDNYIKPDIDGKFIEYIGEISEEEKNEFLGNALALVFPIDWPEPFGLVVIESLARGTPVLARPCGSVPELLLDGVTGYSSFDVRKLADHLKTIHKIKRSDCRSWVEKKFSLERMTEDYIYVYRHIAAQRSGSNRHRWNIVHPFQRIIDGNT